VGGGVAGVWLWWLGVWCVGCGGVVGTCIVSLLCSIVYMSS